MRTPTGTMFTTGRSAANVQSTASERSGALRAEATPTARTAAQIAVAIPASPPKRAVNGIPAA